jgi:hypothetical protein
MDIHRPCQSTASAITLKLYLEFYDAIHGGYPPDHAYPRIHTILAFSFLFPLGLLRSDPSGLISTVLILSLEESLATFVGSTL